MAKLRCVHSIALPFGSSGKVSHPPHQAIPSAASRTATAKANSERCYPDIDKQHPELLAEAKNTYRLGYLVDKLDKTDDWSTNSPGRTRNASPSSVPCSRSPKSSCSDLATAALTRTDRSHALPCLRRTARTPIISIGHRITPTFPLILCPMSVSVMLN